MKQTTQKQGWWVNEGISVHLVDAADQIILAFKTPEQFFTYLTDALTSVHNWGLANPLREQQEDPHWELMRLLRDVYPAWMKGKNRQKDIATGLVGIGDSLGNSFSESIPGLMCAYAYELGDHGAPEPEVSEKTQAGLKALIEIGKYLSDYVNSGTKKSAA